MNKILILSLVGIFILLLILHFHEPELNKIKDITKLPVYTQVKISGKIISLSEYSNNFKSIKLKDSTGEIFVVGNFEKINKEHINKTTEIIGKLSEYNNQPQIQADKITLLD
ncbi:MAG: OB-fold nucleic acid binding domain-containing protein [Candidatus Pacearchaeota archaeon]|jgi:hypothetical protein